MDVPAILSVLNDHGFTDTSTTRKVEVINDTIYDICSREPWPFLEKSVTLTFNGSSGTPTNQPTDFRAVLTVINPSTGRAVKPERLDDFIEAYGSQLTSTGDPICWYWEADVLKVWPIPSSTTTLLVKYLANPTEVTDTSVESAIIIPKRHHRAIVLGAVYKLYDMEDDVELSSRFEQNYEKRLVTMRDDLWKKQYQVPDYIHDTDLSNFDFVSRGPTNY